MSNVIEFRKNPRFAKKVGRYFFEQKGLCYLCGGQMTLEFGFNNTAEVEHIIPKAQQPFDSRFNEAAAGVACNRFKADRPLREVIAETLELKLCQSDVPNAGVVALKAKNILKVL